MNYVVKDSQGNEITKGNVKLNALAGFNLKLKLPATMNLGPATVGLELEENGEAHSHFFQVQEFRRPEFEITARASEAPHFVGSFATITMTAGYYSGGGLADYRCGLDSLFEPDELHAAQSRRLHIWQVLRLVARRSEENEGNERGFKGRTDADGKHTLQN